MGKTIKHDRTFPPMLPLRAFSCRYKVTAGMERKMRIYKFLMREQLSSIKHKTGLVSNKIQSILEILWENTGLTIDYGTRTNNGVYVSSCWMPRIGLGKI